MFSKARRNNKWMCYHNVVDSYPSFSKTEQADKILSSSACFLAQYPWVSEGSVVMLSSALHYSQLLRKQMDIAVPYILHRICPQSWFSSVLVIAMAQPTVIPLSSDTHCGYYDLVQSAKSAALALLCTHWSMWSAVVHAK